MHCYLNDLLLTSILLKKGGVGWARDNSCFMWTKAYKLLFLTSTFPAKDKEYFTLDVDNINLSRIVKVSANEVGPDLLHISTRQTVFRGLDLI